MPQNLLEYFKQLLGSGQQDINLPDPNIGPTDINSILGKVDSIGPTNPRRSPDETLRSATSIGPPGINRPMPRDNNEEFLRRNSSIADIINELGLHPYENADRGIGSVAGLPFEAYAKKFLKRPYVTHGTQKRYDKIDYDRFDKGDVLGDMFHSAENPSYSNEYAMGKAKGQAAEPFNTNTSGSFVSNYGETISPTSIPVVPDAKNILDLIEPNMDDISQAVAFASPSHKRELIEGFKRGRRISRTFKESSDKLDSNPIDIGGLSQDEIRSTIELDPIGLRNTLGLDPRHLPEGVSPDEAPMRMLSENLRLTPEQRNRSPFDAIRYHDMDKKSLAVRQGTPIRSAFGAKLTDDPTPIQVIRSDKSGGGELTLPEGYGKPPIRDKWGTIQSSQADGPSISGKILPWEQTNKFNQASWDALPNETKVWATESFKFDPSKGKVIVGSGDTPTEFIVKEWDDVKPIIDNIDDSFNKNYISEPEHSALSQKLDYIMSDWYEQGIIGGYKAPPVKKLPWEQTNANIGKHYATYTQQNWNDAVKIGDKVKILNADGIPKTVSIDDFFDKKELIDNLKSGAWDLDDWHGVGADSYNSVIDKLYQSKKANKGSWNIPFDELENVAGSSKWYDTSIDELSDSADFSQIDLNDPTVKSAISSIGKDTIITDTTGQFNTIENLMKTFNYSMEELISVAKKSGWKIGQ